MRVLLYGMQSSGASAIAYTMAQRAGCVAFTDIWNMYAAPVLETNADVIAKVVVTTAYPLSVHKARFKPDVTILVLRHPVDNFASLSGKSYVNESGLQGEKFRVLEQIAAAGNEYDHIFYYEDFVFVPASLIEFCNKIGWALDYDALLYRRGGDEIQRHNIETCPAHVGHVRYGLGKFQKQVWRPGLVSFALPAGSTAHLAKMLPNLLTKYRERRVVRGTAWHVPETPRLSCRLDDFIGRALGTAGPLSISPGVQNNIRIGDLPGVPFNRLTGVVYLKNPFAGETQACIRMEDSQGNQLAWQDVRLSHAGLAHFDLAYQPPAGPVAFYLGVSAAENATQNEICFENISLDYFPA